MEKPEGGKPAVLFLEDGSFFLGKGFGAEINITGEVVFNTGMVGYPESMTDPSYAGQILCFTYPLIGNYGVPSMRDRDLFGLPVAFRIRVNQGQRDHCPGEPARLLSHWGSKTTLSEWMRNEGIPGIADIDTRALVTTTGERGDDGCAGKRGGPPRKREMKEMLNNASRYDTIDFVKAVSCRECEVRNSGKDSCSS